ncbi:MAG: hypothetical protein KKB79_03555 [Nanoarchaeota archaeon]|nr:hypothetical protein [Nanoarchaeota archaeon]
MKTEWDLRPLEKGGSFEEKRKKWKESTESFISKWKDRKDYLEDSKALKEALDDYEKWSELYGPTSDEFATPSSNDEEYYFWLKSQINQEDSEVKARYNKVEDFAKELGNKMAFFKMSLADISPEKRKILLENPELKDYEHFLECIFERRAHMLSEEGEKILTLKSAGSYSFWHKMVSEFLSKEEREVLNENGELTKLALTQILSLLDNKDKK